MFAAYDDYVEDLDVMAMIKCTVLAGAIRRLKSDEFYCVNFANYEADYTKSNSSLSRTSSIKVHLFIGSYSKVYPQDTTFLMMTKSGLIFPMYTLSNRQHACRLTAYHDQFSSLPLKFLTHRRLAQNTYPIIDKKAINDGKSFNIDIDTVVWVADLPYRNALLSELSKVATMAHNKVSALDSHSPGESKAYEERIALFVKLHTRNMPVIETIAKDPEAAPKLMPFMKDFATAMSVDLPISHLKVLGSRPNVLATFWEYWIGDYDREHKTREVGDVSYSEHTVKYIN